MNTAKGLTPRYMCTTTAIAHVKPFVYSIINNVKNNVNILYALTCWIHSLSLHAGAGHGGGALPPPTGKCRSHGLPYVAAISVVAVKPGATRPHFRIILPEALPIQETHYTAL